MADVIKFLEMQMPAHRAWDLRDVNYKMGDTVLVITVKEKDL